MARAALAIDVTYITAIDRARDTYLYCYLTRHNIFNPIFRSEMRLLLAGIIKVTSLTRISHAHRYKGGLILLGEPKRVRTTRV